MLDRFALGLLLLVVVLAPLPFGLTAPFPIAACCTVLALALLCADSSRLSPSHLRRLLPALLAFGLYAGVAMMQMSPRVAAWTGAAPIWGDLAAILPPSPGLISWTRVGPWYALGLPLVLILALLTSATLSVDRTSALRLLQAVAVSGSLYALYGILAHLIEPGMLLWRPKTAYLDAVTGTFVNRNTAATYWGSCAVVCLTLALAELEVRGSNPQVRNLAVWLSGLAICLIATAMTGSRAGGLLTITALGLSGGLWLLAHRQVARERWWAAAMGAGALLIVGQMIGGLIGQRVREHGLFDERRAEAYADTWRMIVDHPWLGVGLGNFGSVFPRYRSAELGNAGIWDKAHSTPLEMAVELGLPVTIFIALCCSGIFYVLLTACFRRRRDRGFAIAGIGVGALGLMHSAVDFSLQIAGYAVVFAVIVGCGLGQSVSTRSASQGRNRLDIEQKSFG